MFPWIHEPSTGGTAGIGGGGSVKIDWNYQSATPLTLFNLQPGDIVERVEVTVQTVWDSASPTIEIGVPADPDQIMTTLQNNIKKLGTYSVDDNHLFTASATLRAILDHDGATQGSGFILVYIVRN